MPDCNCKVNIGGDGCWVPWAQGVADAWPGAQLVADDDEERVEVDGPLDEFYFVDEPTAWRDHEFGRDSETFTQEAA